MKGLMAILVSGLLLASGCAVMSEKYDPSDSTKPWSSDVNQDNDSTAAPVPGGGGG